MAEIKFKNLISTANGVGATTGKETAQYFNENFKVTKENLEAIWSILETTVSSTNIEGIRLRPVMSEDDPDTVSYSLFEYNLDGDFENGDWYPIEVLFENLVGDVYQNPQLKRILNSLTPLTRFEPVESQVSINTAQISQNKTDIENLKANDIIQDTRLLELEDTSDRHEKSLRTKANQVLEIFNIIAKGSGYKEGTTIYDQAVEHVLDIDAVDERGGILSVSLSEKESADSSYLEVIDGGFNYSVGDIIETDDPAYRAIVTMIDANGAILQTDLTYEPTTETIGQNASIRVSRGSDAIISMTSYPTIHFQNINDGYQNKIVYYLNSDLTTPYEMIAYPDFVNVQKIIDHTTSSYYALSYRIDSKDALNYLDGDTFIVDGTTWTGTIDDTSTSPYTVTVNIPVSDANNLAGTYTTTAQTGAGSGLQIIVGSEYHPQVTTNKEFNDYMSNHDLYFNSILDNAIKETSDLLKNLISEKVSQADFDIHVSDYNNPHKVTKEQLGLSNVDNTADKDKPISDAVQLELTLLKNEFTNLKKAKIVSTKYYKFLEDSNMLEPFTLYHVGNSNYSYVNESSLDLSGVTSSYVNGEILQINGTEWTVTLLDVSQNPYRYDSNIENVTEFNVSGEYSLTSLTGTGEGLKINILSTEY